MAPSHVSRTQLTSSCQKGHAQTHIQTNTASDTRWLQRTCLALHSNIAMWCLKSGRVEGGSLGHIIQKTTSTLKPPLTKHIDDSNPQISLCNINHFCSFTATISVGGVESRGLNINYIFCCLHIASALLMDVLLHAGVFTLFYLHFSSSRSPRLGGPNKGNAGSTLL